MPIPSINTPEAAASDLSASSGPGTTAPKTNETAVTAKSKRYKIPKIPTKGQLSLKLPEEKNLIFVHNMDSYKLHHVAETGIASPSIGIVHKDKGLSAFGDISLLVHPSKINPKHTPVYDRDVFTPTFKATVSNDYKLNPDRYESFKKDVHEAAKKVGTSPELIEAQLEGVIKTQLEGVIKTNFGKHTSPADLSNLKFTLANHLPKSVMEELGEKSPALGIEGQTYTDFAKLSDKLRGLFDSKKYAQFKDGTKIELTPENEKAILRKIRPSTIKGGEYGGLKSAYYRKDGNEDEALDIHAAKRLKSFADIKQAGKERLVTSG